MSLLNNKSKIIEQDPNDPVQLFTHQKAMVMRCLEIEKISKYGVLASTVGSGKTYSILHLLLLNKIYKGKTNNMIIIPYNIYTQWKESIETYYKGKDMKFISFIDYKTINKLESSKKNIELLNNYDIILTLPIYYNTIINLLKNSKQKFEIERLIIDEIDSVSDFLYFDYNESMKTINSMVNTSNVVTKENTNKERLKQEIQEKFNNYKFTGKFIWFISASFEINNLPPTLLYIYNINEETYKNAICKCDDTFVQDNLKIPEYIEHKITFNSLIIDEIFNNIIENDDTMSKINSNCFSNIEIIKIEHLTEEEKKDNTSSYTDNNTIIKINKVCRNEQELLAEIIVKTKNIIRENTELIDLNFNNLSNIYKYDCNKPYEETLTELKEVIDNCEDFYKDEYVNIFNELKIYYKVKNKALDIITIIIILCKKFNLCCKCFSQTEKKILRLSNCEHTFCLKCVSNNQNITCYICNIENTNNNEIDTNYKEESITKLDYLFDKILLPKLKNNPNNKFLIYTEYEHIFSKIESRCSIENINNSRLDGGNIPDINKIINRYKTENLNILLANSSIYGCGLNLENTDDIIFIHKLPDLDKLQIIGRGQRLGRKNTLNVYSLYYNNELE